MIFSPNLKNFLIIVLSSISLLVVLCMVIDILIQIFKDLKTKSIDPFQFKINNFYFTISCSLIYISFFIVSLYLLRMYNIDRYLDLKEFYTDFINIYQTFKQINIITRIYLLVIFILLIIVFLLLLFVLQNFFLKEIFNLHIYLLGAAKPPILTRKPKYRIYRDITYYLESFSGNDIFIHYLSHTLRILYIKRYGHRANLAGDNSLLGKIQHAVFCCEISKGYKILVALSPLIVIVYDCMYNDWILTHFSYYMLVYVPIMLLKRISYNLGRASYIFDFLFEMYYIEDNKLYCIPLKFKEIFDVFMLTDLRVPPATYTLDLELQLYLMKSFELTDKENNVYTNLEDIQLKQSPDGKFYHLEYEYNEDDENIEILGEEWIVIADKRR